jgi:hypothetical protein
VLLILNTLTDSTIALVLAAMTVLIFIRVRVEGSRFFFVCVTVLSLGELIIMYCASTTILFVPLVTV